ncbi:BTAD domain-containing putative transcriptional regulator [Actinoplanes sp. NPDC049668]|uniref:BTAD domain-containing putative transcriptional regulator n=1 Tax=unclassified Actinoplanes TaxID=2626549 RepID=UPI0033B21EFE
MIQVIAAVRATVVAVTVLAGTPFVLAVFGGSPLPDRVPSAAQLHTWLQDPLRPQYVPATARAVAWLIWALLAAMILAVWSLRVRRWHWRWARAAALLPGPVQGLAATVLGAATVTSTVGALPVNAAAPTTVTDTDATAITADIVPVLAAAASRQTAEPGKVSRTVTVHRGDTLWDIAATRLGDPHQWRQIYQLNNDRYRHMRGGRHIEPGWTLTLPARTTAPDRRPPRPGITPPHRPDTSSPGSPAAGAVPRASATAGPSAAAPSASRDAETAPPHAGGPTAGQAPHPSPTAPADPRIDGRAVPHGWITLPLAASLAAAGATVWLRRRHRTVVPAQRRRTTDDDPSLTPLSPMIAAIRHKVGQQEPTSTGTSSTPPSVIDAAGLPAAVQPDLPPPGPTAAVLSGTGDTEPGTGRGLVGAGAESAARALLVAALSSGTPADPDTQGLAIVTADTLTALLGGAAAPADIPRLHVSANFSDALAHLEDLVIERHRHLQDHDVDDLPALRAADPRPPMPPALLITCRPPENLHARLCAALLLSTPLQIQAIILGEWPHGETTAVQADGHTGSERFAVLDTATTIQHLAALHEMHTGEAASPTPVASTAPADPAEDQPDDAADADPGHNRTGMAAAPGHMNSDNDSTPAPPDGAGDAEHTAPTHRTGGTRPATDHRVRIRLLGAPAIHDRDNNPVAGLRHHARELLVYLTIHRDGADLPDIMEALWPTATMRRAAQRLSTETADLRRRIRQAAGDTTIQPVVNTGGRYHLNPTLLDIDVWRLNDTLRRARTADPDDRTELLRQAIDVHTGTLAQGYDYEWIEPAREHFRRCGIRSRLELADLLAPHDQAAATSLLHAAAALDPTNEDLARRVMRACAQTGDRTGIRAVLQQLQEALHGIDEEPSEETLALAAQLQDPNE